LKEKRRGEKHPGNKFPVTALITCILLVTYFFILRGLYFTWKAVDINRSASDSTLQARSFCRYCQSHTQTVTYYYANTNAGQ